MIIGNMNLLTRLALKGPLITLLAMLIVMIGGAFTLTRLQVELFPDVDFPLITLTTVHPDVDAEGVLEQITIPLEESLSGIAGVETIRSVSSDGISIIMAELNLVQI